MSNLRVDLAHHLSAQDAERLGLPAEDLKPSTTIVVPEEVARGLIGAGYAQVDTEDIKAVQRALNRHAPAGHPLGVLREPEPQGEPEKGEPATSVDPGEGTAPAAKRSSGRSEK